MTEDLGEMSDGYHTFNELYYHRMVLFSIICNQNKDKAWKSKLHADGTMFEGYFIVGITTPVGDYTYHYSKEYWYDFDVPELEFAHKWDGHKPEDIERLYTITDRGDIICGKCKYLCYTRLNSFPPECFMCEECGKENDWKNFNKVNNDE